MASTINEIIKESLETLKKEHLTLTPDNYTQVFCSVAKKKGVVVEDCQKVDKCLQRLDTAYAQEAKRHKIQTVDELLSFFVAKINRLNPTESSKIIESLVMMSRRILQATSLLHNAKARNLANASLERLELNHNLQSSELIKEKWFSFITEYDDSYLRKLDSFGTIDTSDLEKMTNDIYRILNQEDDGNIYRTIAPLIIATLTPSIASSMNDELATISYELRNSPEVLGSSAIQADIKKFIKKRIELDKKEVSEKITALDKLLDEINKKIAQLINSSETSSKEVKNIKEDLKEINFSTDSFEAIQAKLMHIASSLESETHNLSEQMHHNKLTISKLHTRIKKLETALISAKQESKEDYLTNVATKRALTSEIKRAEEAYIRYKIDYCICFLDLDHFKMVNDTYGHEAGDVILSTVGKILNKYTRQVDFVGRYGGEEFLVILPNTDLKQSTIFADKIRTIIENFKFMYKNERINVTVSCGVAQRKDYKTEEAAIDAADKMLYQAKEGGRNRVMPSL